MFFFLHQNYGALAPSFQAIFTAPFSDIPHSINRASTLRQANTGICSPMPPYHFND